MYYCKILLTLQDIQNCFHLQDTEAQYQVIEYVLIQSANFNAECIQQWCTPHAYSAGICPIQWNWGKRGEKRGNLAYPAANQRNGGLLPNVGQGSFKWEREKS